MSWTRTTNILTLPAKHLSSWISTFKWIWYYHHKTFTVLENASMNSVLKKEPTLCGLKVKIYTMTEKVAKVHTVFTPSLWSKAVRERTITLVFSSETPMPNHLLSDSMMMEHQLWATSQSVVKSKHISSSTAPPKMWFHNITMSLASPSSHPSGLWDGNKPHGNIPPKILLKLHLTATRPQTCLSMWSTSIFHTWINTQISQLTPSNSQTSKLSQKICKRIIRNLLLLLMLPSPLRIPQTNTINKVALMEYLFNQQSTPATNTVRIWSRKSGQNVLFSSIGSTKKYSTHGHWVLKTYLNK